ncbi:MAG: hypothetical protein G3M70_11220 [Candidatus Nitronauta litoralis]|uniref:Uncharacterized protein n=1 Tax=Candidatus Nitronauta litoralis TaxID=2705533 RepID=A0A7T0BWX6_9BACT|nr:MAG: hypothetical protein G3M70_11220 [Candidatus Nitronauta litoralis]
MTGFIQRLLSRGTGQNPQPNQVTFQPRPRSRFELKKTAAFFDNPTPNETSGNEESESSRIETPSAFPTHRQPKPKPTSKKTASLPTAESLHAGDQEMKNQEAPLPLSRNEDSPLADNTTPSNSNQPVSETFESETGKTQSIKEGIFKATPEDRQGTRNVLPEKLEQKTIADKKSENPSPPGSIRENPVTQLFKVIEEHNSRVAAQDNDQNNLAVENTSTARKKEEPEGRTTPRQTPDFMSETKALKPIENKTEPVESPEKTISPGVNISIGQIQVEFVQPEPGINQQPKPTIQRTRGFDGYSRVRRGYPSR